MNRFGILATLHARPGKEAEVETFLESAAPLVEPRPAQPLGMRFGLARRPLASLTPSVTRKGVSHMSVAKWQRRYSGARKNSL